MLEILEKYHVDGLLHKQTHPTLDLTIWNYSPRVQYERLWDDITMQCRGLVTNSKGDIVARPFKKFFNYEEHKPEDLPNESFEVYEKMDGSLGILFYYEYELSDERRYNIWFNNNYETGMERFFDPNNLPDFDNSYYEPTPKTKGEWILATRGSFTSPQAIKGKELLEKYNFERLNTGYTYLFEIIYKENRIVCDYDYDDLVLLGINTKTGDEVNIHNDDEDIRFKNMISNIGFRVVMLYKTWGETYDLLKEEISNDREGYVIRFKNGFRMKIKGEEYKRLHKILTNFSSKDIWELMKEGKPMDEFLDRVPDEFYKWVKQQVSSFELSLERISNHCSKIHEYFRYGKYNDVDPEPSKKDFALHLEKCNVETFYRPILFAMWDGKPYEHIIWRIMKPKFEKPFKNDET
jgi:RNA ligase